MSPCSCAAKLPRQVNDVTYMDADEHIFDDEQISFSIGSNMGDRLAYLQCAVDRLDDSELLEVLAVSSVYETDPVGGPEQDDFLNAVVLCKSERHITIKEFIELINSIEQAAGRRREIPNGPRTLDIDVLAVGNRVSDDPHMLIPHPHALDRAFVIIPWAEVFPDCELPGSGWMDAPKSLAEHSANLSPEDLASVRKREDLGPLTFS